MRDTGFTAGQREKMVCIMDLNGYEQDGEGPRFICLDSGDVLEFPNWMQVFDFINQDPEIHGILVMRPLPKQIDEAAMLRKMNPLKDLDGITDTNVAGVMRGDADAFAPCTAQAVVEILKGHQIEMAGKEVCIIGRSMVVGKPLSMLLLQENATVTVCHSKTPDLQSHCLQADILVSAVGHAGLITADRVKEGAVVIDVAMNRGQDGKLCGDVDYAAASEKAAYITPVPGGVGPMTRAMLMKNTYLAAQRRRNG